MLHGPVGAELLRHEDGLDDNEILDAVRYHTTGHPSLTELGLLVFISDKLEPNKIKSYPYQQELRHIANESLGQATLEFLCRESGTAPPTPPAGPPRKHRHHQRPAVGRGQAFSDLCANSSLGATSWKSY